MENNILFFVCENKLNTSFGFQSSIALKTKPAMTLTIRCSESRKMGNNQHFFFSEMLFVFLFRISIFNSA